MRSAAPSTNLVVSAIAATLTVAAARAQNVVYAQTFDDATPAPILTNPNDPFGNLHTVVTNAPVDPVTGSLEGPGFSHDGTGPGWSLSWADVYGYGAPGPITSQFDYGDTIGVVASTAAFTPLVHGSPALVIADADGEIRLTLDPLDVSGLTGLSMRFELAIGQTGYESLDSFRVLANGTAVHDTSGDALQSRPRPGWNVLGGFGTAWIDLTAFEGTDPLAIEFVFANDGSAEVFALDTIEVGENLLPTPGTIGIIVLSGLAFARRAVRYTHA